jgi:hypothetical protein
MEPTLFLAMPHFLVVIRVPFGENALRFHRIAGK